MKIIADKRPQLEAARKAKKLDVEGVQANILGMGYAFDGERVDVMPKDQVNLQNLRLQLLAGVVSPHGGFFRFASNKTKPMDDHTLAALIDGALQWVGDVQRVALRHKHAIETFCTSITAVEIYDITVAWP